jgi:hypothetical protein
MQRYKSQLRQESTISYDSLVDMFSTLSSKTDIKHFAGLVMTALVDAMPSEEDVNKVLNYFRNYRI